MKSILLAAAALVAVPAIAQTSGSTTAPADTAAMQTTPPAGDAATTMAPADPAPAPTGSSDPAAQAAPPAGDPAMQGQSMPMGAQTTGAAPMAGGTPTQTAGGYAPATAGTAAPLAPGQMAQVRAQPTPDQAFPAPAPKASYPICKKGQYDGCMQASAAGGRRRR